MKKLLTFGLLGLAIAVASANAQRRNVGFLPPSPLDAVFERANSEDAVNDELVKNDLYKKAVQAALKAKKEQEQRLRDNPKLVGPSPAQAARQMFLTVLTGATPVMKSKQP